MSSFGLRIYSYWSLSLPFVILKYMLIITDSLNDTHINAPRGILAIGFSPIELSFRCHCRSVPSNFTSTPTVTPLSHTRCLSLPLFDASPIFVSPFLCMCAYCRLVTSVIRLVNCPHKLHGILLSSHYVWLVRGFTTASADSDRSGFHNWHATFCCPNKQTTRNFRSFNLFSGFVFRFFKNIRFYVTNFARCDLLLFSCRWSNSIMAIIEHIVIFSLSLLHFSCPDVNTCCALRQIKALELEP